jgi:hypothetical protein
LLVDIATVAAAAANFVSLFVISIVISGVR